MSQHYSIFFFDLQGFKSKNNFFIVKELCMIPINENLRYLFVIKPPFNYNKLTPDVKKQVKWLERYFHGYNWNDGFISYQNTKKQLIDLLSGSNRNTIFVKGEEKIKWVEKMFQNDNLEINCFNIEELGFYSDISRTDKQQCEYHEKQFVCAYSNCMSMKKWFIQNQFEEQEINL